MRRARKYIAVSYAGKELAVVWSSSTQGAEALLYDHLKSEEFWLYLANPDGSLGRRVK